MKGKVRGGKVGKGWRTSTASYGRKAARAVSVLAMLALLVVVAFVFETMQPTTFGARVLALFSSPSGTSDTWVGTDVIGSLPRDADGQLQMDAGDLEGRPMPAPIKQRLGELKAQRDRVYGSLRRGQFPTDPPDLLELEIVLPTGMDELHPGINP